MLKILVFETWHNGELVKTFCKLFYYRHLFEQMVSISHLVDDEEHIPYVECDVPAFVRVKYDIAHGAFPNPVEIQTDKVAVCVDDRAS